MLSKSKIFLSYSHQDKKYMEDFFSATAIMRRASEVIIWSDKDMAAGEELDEEIKKQIIEADVIVLFISNRYFDSYYCYDREFEFAYQKHKKGDARLIPVIVSDCDWKNDTRISQLLSATPDAKPLSHYENIEAGYLDVVKNIRKYLERKHMKEEAIEREGNAKLNAKKTTEQSVESNLLYVFESIERINNRVNNQFYDSIDTMANSNCFDPELLIALTRSNTYFIEQELIDTIAHITYTNRNDYKSNIIARFLTEKDSRFSYIVNNSRTSELSAEALGCDDETFSCSILKNMLDYEILYNSSNHRAEGKCYKGYKKSKSSETLIGMNISIINGGTHYVDAVYCLTYKKAPLFTENDKIDILLRNHLIPLYRSMLKKCMCYKFIQQSSIAQSFFNSITDTLILP